MDPITKLLLEAASVDGYLYHYSNTKNPILYTINTQDGWDKKSTRYDQKKNANDPLGRGLDYGDQISFFLEALPIEIIRDRMPDNIIYNKTLYEHAIKIDDIEPDIVFQVVIAPIELLIIRILYNNIKNRDTAKKFLKIYARLTSILYKKQGISALKTVQLRYAGETERSMIEWVDSKDPVKVANRKKNYQSGTVHVKLYPKDGNMKSTFIKVYKARKKINKKD